MVLIVLIAIWVVLGLLMGILAGSIWKGERPYGQWADYVIAILLAIGTGLIDWYLVADWFNLEGTLKFLAAIVEPAVVSLLGLWVLRLIRR